MLIGIIIIIESTDVIGSTNEEATVIELYCEVLYNRPTRVF